MNLLKSTSFFMLEFVIVEVRGIYCDKGTIFTGDYKIYIRNYTYGLTFVCACRNNPLSKRMDIDGYLIYSDVYSRYHHDDL